MTSSNEKQETKGQKILHEAINELQNELESGSSKRYLELLDFKAKFHKYSFYNTILISIQNPQAEYLKGFRQWQKEKAFVKKGQKGSIILAPMIVNYIVRENGNGSKTRVYFKDWTNEEKETATKYKIIRGFKDVYVFDIKQTDYAGEIPSFFYSLGNDHEALYNNVIDIFRSQNIQITINEGTREEGSFSPITKEIKIKNNPGDNMLLTLLHELGHYYHAEIKEKDDEAKKDNYFNGELIAESVSYIVSKFLGLKNPFSSDYIINWKGSAQDLEIHLNKVSSISNKMMQILEKGLPAGKEETIQVKEEKKEVELMSVKIKTKELKDILSVHKKVSQVKTSNFILQGINLKADDNLLTVTSTNLEQILRSKIECEVKIPGECVVPYKSLENIVNCCDDDFIILEINDKNELIADNVKISTFSLEEFPVFPVIKPEIVMKSLDYDDLIKSLNMVIDSASTDESRVILTGVAFDTTNKCLKATDSYRLAMSEFNFKKDVGLKVIPREACPVLKEIAKQNKKAKFDLSFKDDQITFKIGDHYLITRVLTGKYPEIDKLMPKEVNYQYQIKTVDLIKVIDKANKLFKNDGVPLKMSFNTVKVETEINVRELGNYHDVIPMQTIKKPQKENTGDLTIAFNPCMLKDCIKNFETVTVDITDPLKPALFYTNNSLKYLLMPVRIA